MKESRVAAPAFVVGVVAIFAASCATVTTQPVSHVRQWDFRNTRHISVLPWPEEKRNRPLLVLQVDGDVRIWFTPTEKFEGYVEIVDFSRDGDEVDLVQLSLEKQSTRDVYATAKQLAAEWKIDADRLEQWYEAVQRGESNTVHLARRGTMPAVDIEIFKTLNDARPYAITFRVGWVGGESAR